MNHSLGKIFNLFIVWFVMQSSPIHASLQTTQNHKKPGVGVGILVIEDGKILLGKRKGSHGSSMWGPPGGHLEFGETVEECVQRELFEETSLVATSLSLGGWTEDFFYSDHAISKHYISLFAVVHTYEGNVQLMEPDKCSGWYWISLRDLPKDLFKPLATYLSQNNIRELK